MVLFFVEEVLLGEDEVGGEEDVEAEGIEEGVESGGGGGVEGWKGAWRVDCQQLLACGGWDGVGGTVFSPRGCGCEGAGLGDEAAEAGAAVVGWVGGEGGHYR